MRKQLLPKPEAPEGGTYIRDPDTGEEVFVTFEEMKYMCSEMMKVPEHIADGAYGKPRWDRDSTYEAPNKKARPKGFGQAPLRPRRRPVWRNPQR